MLSQYKGVVKVLINYDEMILKEAKEAAIERHLKVFPLDTENFIKVNELKEITNPLFFESTGIPTSDGLLSNEIFGITKDDRTSIFGYVSLGQWFMHPLLYKTWDRLDSNMKNVLSEVDTYIYDESKGKFIVDKRGKTGLKYIKEVLETKTLKKNTSAKRNKKIDFIERYKDKLFINKLIIIPAGYRDVDTEGGSIGVGEINQLYTSIIRDSRALKESDDYGLTMNGTLRFRIQENIMKIYNWFIFGRDPVTGQDSQAAGLSRKLGLMRRAGTSKSFDWGSRLVICTQNLRKDKIEDLDIGVDEIGVPLAAICANLFPYMLFWIRRYFETNLSDMTTLATIDRDSGNRVQNHRVKDWQMVYSDDRIKKELDKFMHGMAKRFIPIEAPIDDPELEGKVFLQFKGRSITDNEEAERIKRGEIRAESHPLVNRPLTWCDLIYRAAVEMCSDKMALITRYPMDTYWNQFPAKVKVISTIETEPIMVDNIYYPKYPKIEMKDMNTNSSNRFVDVGLPNNVRLDSIGGDFDGDTISVKIPYSIEANDELSKAIENKMHYISLGGKNKMTTIHEGVQSLYQLTMCLEDDKDKFTDPIF